MKINLIQAKREKKNSFLMINMLANITQVGHSN